MPNHVEDVHGKKAGAQMPGAADPLVLPMGVLSLDDFALQVNSAMQQVLSGAEGVLSGEAVADIARAVMEGRRDGLVTLRAEVGTTEIRLGWSVLSGPENAPRSVMLLSVPAAPSTAPTADSHWRQVLARAVDLTWTADESGTVLTVNAGTPRPDWMIHVLGRQWFEFVHPADQGVARAAWERVLQGGRTETESFEARAGLGDGASRWLRITMTDLRNDPAIGAVVGTAVGIAEVGAALVPPPEADEEFRGSYTRSGLPQMMLDLTGKTVSVNDAYCRLVGRGRGELTGVGFDRILPDDGPGLSGLNAVIAGGTDHSRIATALQGPQGNAIPVEVDLTILRSEAGEPVGAALYFLDVTQARQLREPTREDGYAAAATFLAGDMGLVADIDGNLAYVTPELARLLGASQEELRGSQRWGTVHIEDLPAVREVYSAVAADHQPRSVRYRVLTADGNWRWFEGRMAPFADATLEGVVCNLRDITAQVVAEFALTSMIALRDATAATAAVQDPLTGLLNRLALVIAADHTLARDSGDVGMLFADIDGFRGLNDTLGRAAGDEVLVAVAERIRRAVGAEGSVARVGGDEFAVLVDDGEHARIERLGRAVIAAVAEPLTIEGAEVVLSVAVGIARSTHGPAEGLLHCADIAMRMAKASGSGAPVAYDQGAADATEREDALGSELRAALSAGDLYMQFQPIVDLTSGVVVGVEALARWTHARLGPIEPLRIVAAAERFGLSAELDRWALRTAFQAARTLQRTGTTPRDAYVSVNLTAGAIGARGLEEYIVAEVAASGLTPAHVLLELTQTALMDAALVVDVLRRLRAKGFRVAIDDFGTGYSSLAYLRDLPVTMLKVDRSFVAEIRSDSDALAIVASIIDLARSVGVTSVAKGVETLDQAGLLRELGCQYAQGWLWSQALSIDDVTTTRAWSRAFDVGAGVPTPAPQRRARFPIGPEHGLERMLSMHAKGASLATIAASLNADGYLTPKGLRWHGTSVARAIADAAIARRTAPRHPPRPR